MGKYLGFKNISFNKFRIISSAVNDVIACGYDLSELTIKPLPKGVISHYNTDEKAIYLNLNSHRLRYITYHEIGHFIFYRRNGDLQHIPYCEFSFDADRIWNMFLSCANVEGELSYYAQTCYEEFVAEAFANLMYGKELSEEIIQEYYLAMPKHKKLVKI